MSRVTLPQLADVRKLATSATVLEGELSLDQLPRVRDALFDDSGKVSYRLSFGFGEEGHITIDGCISATVVLACQRCLQAMVQPIASEFALAVVLTDEQANQLPDRFEPLVLADGLVDPATIIEDELLLCLPIVAFHQQSECERDSGYSSQDDDYDSAQAAKVSPFDALAALKKQ